MLEARVCSRRAENVDFSIFSSGCKQANLSTNILSPQSYKNSPTPQNNKEQRNAGLNPAPHPNCPETQVSNRTPQRRSRDTQ